MGRQPVDRVRVVDVARVVQGDLHLESNIKHLLGYLTFRVTFLNSWRSRLRFQDGSGRLFSGMRR